MITNSTIMSNAAIAAAVTNNIMLLNKQQNSCVHNINNEYQNSQLHKLNIQKEEKTICKKQNAEKLLDYLLLSQSCNDLICPLDLFDPVTWEFKKEECPFNKSCFDITIVDWHNGLNTSIGSIGCFMYGENSLLKKNSPIKKIIKKLKYNERNINIFNEHY